MRRDAIFVRRVVSSFNPRKCRRARLRVESLEAREVPTVTGSVFLDQNLNGTKNTGDAGVSGVIVTATDANGVVETTNSGANGQYTLQSNATDLRIVFSNLPSNAQPGRVAGTSGPLVRFLTTGSARTGVDLALAAPRLVTTQFNYDAAGGANSDQPAVLAVPYGADSSTTPDMLATAGQIGSVWGLTYQPGSNNLFASSFVKRHAGLGPNAAGTGTTTGGIYRIDPTGAHAPALLVDLNTAGAGLGTGADPHPTKTEANGGDWFHDAATLPVVGKVGLGGMAISADGSTLYTVNLATRELIEIPLKADGTLDTGRSIRHTPVPLTNPTGSGISSFTADDLRPFAVAVRNGVVYVGETYTAETSGSAADLRAFVYAFDPATGAFRTFDQSAGTFSDGAPAPVITTNLTYTRGAADDPTPNAPHSGDEVSANWQAWTGSFPTNLGQAGFPVHPSPWLTGIAFDGSAMVLGLRDRFGDQGGYQTGNAAPGNTSQFSVIASGDILRTTASGAGWQLESNGAVGGLTAIAAGDGQGPGGGEFYQDGSVQNGKATVPQDATSGAVAQVPGFATVATTGSDVLGPFTGGIYTFFNRPVGPVLAGAAGPTTELYESQDSSTFGDANGLGGLTALPAGGTVQVGDRVFQDTNNNGVQDAGEPGISGVTVALFLNGTQVDSTRTASDGSYHFTTLKPNTAYELRIDTTQVALTGRALVTAHMGTDPQVDSDAMAAGTTTTIAFTAGDAGTSDNSLDFGFGSAPTPTPTLTVGGTVWSDKNNNGHIDAGESGIGNVVVDLLAANGTTVLQTTKGGPDGTYTFAGLSAGTYKVRLVAGNFQLGGSAPLARFTPSAPTSGNPDDDVDGDNNGMRSGVLGSDGFVISGSITLAAGTEPTDPNTNMTVDFGMVPPAPPATLTVGNQVWNDANGNGVFDLNEIGIDGVTVQLVDPSGAVLKTATTAGGGVYTFTGLAAGQYKVRLPATDFNTGGALANFINSETGTTSDPNDNVNNNNDGKTFGVLGSGGFVESGLITLAAGTGPLVGGNTDPNANLTLDFGVKSRPVNTLTLGDRVFKDTNNNGRLDSGETGIAGVSLQLLYSSGDVARTTTTDSTGTYAFDGLNGGQYKVRVTAANFQPGAPLDGMTNSNGTAVGTLGSATGVVQSPSVTLTAGIASPTVELGFNTPPPPVTTATLAGRVFLDFNNNGAFNGSDAGMSGVTLTLSGGSLPAPLTTQTDSSGNYSFANVPAGTYTLTETQPTTPANVSGKVTAGTASGTASSPANSVTGITLKGGDAATGYNFAEIPLVSASGSVFEDLNGNGKKDAGEPGAAGATVTLTGMSVVTGTITPVIVTPNAAGDYTFPNLTPGTYTITETQPAGYLDAPEQNGLPLAATVTNDKFSGIDLTTMAAGVGYNFGEVKTGSLSGTIFADANNDGTKAASGEPGISGVTVRLTGTDDLGHAVNTTFTTGTDGSFQFTGLRPGTYNLAETQPAGYLSGKVTAGAAQGTTANDQVTAIHLTSGAAAGGYLFAEQPRADLALTQAPAATQMMPGGTVTITYTLKNTGTAIATAAGVVMNFAGLTFVSASTPAAFNATTKTWTVGDLAAGATATIQITFRAVGAGRFVPSAQATTTAAELSTANNRAASTIAVGVPIADPPAPVRFAWLRSRLWFLSSTRLWA